MSITEAQDSVDIIEDEEILVDLNEVEEEESEDEPEETVEKAETESEDEFDLPDKFKGKSISDIVESYSNLEKEYGRRNNEVGELRKLTDQLLSLERKPEETVEEEEDTDFFDNPQAAVDKAISNNPLLKELTETVTKKERAEALKEFEGVHPDWKQVMGSEEFLQWAGKSRVRAKMLLEASDNYDYATGAELIGEYKELHPVDKGDNEDDTSEDTEEALKDVTTETKSKSKHSRKKIYKRAQLINMKLTDPEGYAAREDEFLQAYAEGRVR